MSQKCASIRSLGSGIHRQAHATRKVIIFLFFALCINCDGRSWIGWMACVCRWWWSVWVSAVGTVDAVDSTASATAASKTKRQNPVKKLILVRWMLDDYMCVCARVVFGVCKCHSPHLYRELDVGVNWTMQSEEYLRYAAPHPQHTIHVRWIRMECELSAIIRWIKSFHLK